MGNLGLFDDGDGMGWLGAPLICIVCVQSAVEQ